MADWIFPCKIYRKGGKNTVMSRFIVTEVIDQYLDSVVYRYSCPTSKHSAGRAP